MPDEPSGVAAVLVVAALSALLGLGVAVGFYELATWLLT